MPFSSIKKKRCKCGCNKYPTISFQGWNFACAPDDVKQKVGTQKEAATKVRNARLNISSKLRNDDELVRRALLMKADGLFSAFIKDRDSDAEGNITCICCNQPFNTKDKNEDGFIVQPLHFISRSVYSLRFDEKNCAAGCTYCNLDMHLNPEGEAYKSYLDKLILKLGVGIVFKMQAEKRNINKISNSDLQQVILKYSKK